MCVDFCMHEKKCNFPHMLCKNGKHYTTWKNIPNKDKTMLLKHMNDTKNMWLDTETFQKHKVTIAPKFTYLLGDALGLKQKESKSTWAELCLYTGMSALASSPHASAGVNNAIFHTTTLFHIWYLTVEFSTIAAALQFILPKPQTALSSLGFFVDLELTTSRTHWNWQIHHRIKPDSVKQVTLIKKSRDLTVTELIREECETLSSRTTRPKLIVGINKNAVLADYEKFCHLKGITTQVSTTTNKGKNQIS